MIKAYTIEMIEKLARTDGTVKAGENGTKNCYLGAVKDGVVTAPSETGAGLKLFSNYGKGDDMYREFVVPAGEYMTAYDVESWVGKMLQVSPESITYAQGDTYASITKGTVMKAGEDGNLAIASASTGDLCFEVKKKIDFGGNGVLVEIKKA